MSSSVSVKKRYTSRAAAIERVERDLRARIAAGLWKPGIMLPSRRDLAKEFDVDLHTLQRAILPLLGDGTLQADGGRGTFVAQGLSSVRPTDSEMPELSTGSTAAAGVTDTPPTRIGTLGIIAAYDTTRSGTFNIADVGTRGILRSLEREFAEASGRTVFFNLFRAGTSWIPVAEAGESLLRMGADALAVVGINNDPELGDIGIPGDLAANVPVIHISGAGSCQPRIHVFYDQRQAGYQAAEHLLKIGCRHLLFLVPFEEDWLEERVQGARIALRDARHRADALSVFPFSHPLRAMSPEVETGASEIIRQAFDEHLMTGGVITPNDGVAHLVLKIAAERGRMPGRDFALVGFDDIPNSRFCGLTSIRPPFEEMGEEAVRLLLRHLRGEKVHLQICLRSHLIVRASSSGFAAC